MTSQPENDASQLPVRANSVASRLNHIISRLLITGLSLSIAAMLAGVALYLAGRTAGNIHSTSFSVLGHGLLHFDAAGFLNLGILLLLVTPMARVAALLIMFVVERQARFAVVSFCVLALLVLCAVLGLALA